MPNPTELAKAETPNTPNIGSNNTPAPRQQATGVHKTKEGFLLSDQYTEKMLREDLDVIEIGGLGFTFVGGGNSTARRDLLDSMQRIADSGNAKIVARAIYLLRASRTSNPNSYDAIISNLDRLAEKSYLLNQVGGVYDCLKGNDAKTCPPNPFSGHDLFISENGAPAEAREDNAFPVFQGPALVYGWLAKLLNQDEKIKSKLRTNPNYIEVTITPDVPLDRIENRAKRCLMPAPVDNIATCTAVGEALAMGQMQANPGLSYGALGELTAPPMQPTKVGVKIFRDGH